MSQMIEVKSGIGTLRPIGMGTFFLGSTAEGEYPPTGQSYPVFSFKPTAGEGGVLAFRYENAEGPKYLCFYQFWWKGDGSILKVVSDIDRPVNAYSRSDELGLVVQVNGWQYVTGTPRDTDHNYKVVDLFDMLRYIEGKIDVDELDKSAVTREARATVEQGFAELLAELRGKDVVIGGFKQVIKDINRDRRNILDQLAKMDALFEVLDRKWMKPQGTERFLDAMAVLAFHRLEENQPVPEPVQKRMNTLARSIL